jgi:cell division protein FtsW
MYVRAGSSSPVQEVPEQAEGEAPPGPGPLGGAWPLRAPGLAEVGERVRAARALLDRPLTSYYILVGITTLLLSLGLVMVLSTAAIADLVQGESPYHDFIVQLVGITVVGVPIAWVATRCQPRLFRAAAYPLLAVSAIGLCLVLVPGVAAHSLTGASREIAVGPLAVQPSELAKLALALWGADLLARKEKLGMLKDWRHILVPLLPGAGVLSLLVMAEDDLGTTIILLLIFMALLWIVGTPGRVFAALLVLMGLVVLMLMVAEPYRVARLTEFLNNSPVNTDPFGPNQQPIQGRYALGSGGLFGVGLGASREKWGYVPESTSDFVFAILGEELGLVGTLCVTFLYGALAYAGLRVARRVPDTFSKLLAAAITVWIVGQAVVNIGAVIGFLPITGVPLPLVSKGLSSVLVTMLGLGMLMSFARREEGASQALAARRASPGNGPRSWLRRGRKRLFLSGANARGGARQTAGGARAVRVNRARERVDGP